MQFKKSFILCHNASNQHVIAQKAMSLSQICLLHAEKLRNTKLVREHLNFLSEVRSTAAEVADTQNRGINVDMPGHSRPAAMDSEMFSHV